MLNPKGVMRTGKNFARNVTSGKNKFLLAVGVIVLVVLALVVVPLSGQIYSSYTNAYEGAKPSFAGIQYNEHTYTSNTNQYSNTGTGFSFKGDAPFSQFSGLPKIVGEMTPVFIPQNTGAGDIPSSFSFGGFTIPNPFTNTFALINNPYHTYSWNISTGSRSNLYTMEEWKTKFYVSISANPDGSSVPLTSSEWDQANGRYSDVKIWIKLDTAPTWYFQGQDKAYFAIAQVQLAGISYNGHSSDGSVQTNHNSQNVIVDPSSPSSPVTLYMNNFGANNVKSLTKEEYYSYQGVQLNPQYFGDAVYFCISLNSFGSQSWGPLWDWEAQGDVVTFDFTVTQFVVGTWTVQNTQPVPVGYGRQSSYSEYGIAGLNDFFASPWFYTLLAGIGLLVLFVIILIFAPWILFAIASLFKRGKKR